MDSKGIESFRHHLRRLEREVAGQLRHGVICCGVTLAQCHAVLEIGAAGNTSISQLAETLGLDKSTLSRTIDGMVKMGWVERVIDPHDRRYMQVTLTDTGGDKFDSINQLCNGMYRKIFDHIPEEKHAQVSESMIMLVDAMEIAKKEYQDQCV